MAQLARTYSANEIKDHYENLKHLLEDRRNTILKKIEAERAELADQQYRNQGNVGDIADASVGDMSTDYLMRIADHDRRELAEIDQALSRMQHGDYGICESCETEIAVERLQKLPFARRCIECQSTLEARHAVSHPLHLPKL